MTTADARVDLIQSAEETGWSRRDLDRVDIYDRGTTKVRVIWGGAGAISGASLYHDDILTTYTRDLATVTGWLSR
jgi:hypothetical protein